MRIIVKHILGIFIILLSITIFSTVSYAAELTINGDHVIYTNKNYNFSTKLPLEAYVLFDKKMYCDGEKLDVADDNLNAAFEQMEAFGALFIYSDYDFTYEISCSVLPLSSNDDWDMLCAEIENGNHTASEIFSGVTPDDVKEKYGDRINDANASMLADYLDNANISLEKINGYNYLVTVYQGSRDTPYITQYITGIENKEFIFKFQQYSGSPSNEALDTFHQIINSSTLPQKSVKATSNVSATSKTNGNLTENIFVRLIAFVGIIAVIYGLSFLNNGRHKKEGPVLWSPEIDYAEIPFSNPLSLREHILKNPHNLSFLFRNTALDIAKSKKPFLSFGCVGMWIIAVILPIAESIFTQNWWILISIPVGLLIPTYSRRIKSWMQIIPIAIGTIFSNPIIFFICINFVIVRSLYDLWYSSVLKTAGEIVCANDKLFSQAWNDTALAVLVDGEPYFHGKLTQSDENLIPPSNHSSQNTPKDIEPQKAIEHIAEPTETDIKTIQPPKQDISIDDRTISPADDEPEPIITNTPMIKFCNKCGQKLETDYRFCLKCGNPIERSNIETGAQLQAPSKEQQNSAPDKPSTNKSKRLSDEDIKQIKYWKQLLDDGIITEDEFKDKKKDILGD